VGSHRAGTGETWAAELAPWSRVAGALDSLSAAALALVPGGEAGAARSLLRALCEAAAGDPQVDGAGVMSWGPAGRLAFVHAVPARIATVERLQQITQEGPCRECTDQRAALVVGDLATDPRWPQLTSRAKEMGLVSVAAIPLLARGEPWGVLDLYRTSAAPWTEQELSGPRLLAQVTASYLALAAEREAVTVARDDFEHLATHDQLTGLPNRGLLLDLLEHATLTASRRGSTVAVLFVNIDNFKGLKDAFGHEFGDSVLVEVAKRLRTAIRASDTLTRLSRDEYVIVCEDLSGSTTGIHQLLRALGRRIQRQLRTPSPAYDPDDPTSVEIVVSASIGAALSTDATDVQVLLHWADRAMYRAKQQGGGRLQLHTTHLQLASTIFTHRDARHPHRQPDENRT